MTEIQTLLILMVILYILNYLTINKPFKKVINKDSFVEIKKKSYNLDKKEKIKKYGQIQYDVINYDDDNTKYKYQDIPKNNEFLLNDNKNIKNNESNILKKTLPSQQDIIYDTKFYQPSDANTYKPFDLTKINYKERKIQNIYDEIVNGPKIKTKKQIHDSSEFVPGASGLKTYKNIDWEYEDDNDGMSYDPLASTISIF
jgi:hypothetical protein